MDLFYYQEKKVKKVIFILIILFGIKLHAALPPFFHTLREIEAIISDSRLHEELGGGEPILEVKRVDEGYLILTNRYTLKVEVIYHFPHELWCGIGEIELKFNEKEVRSDLDTINY